MRFSPLPSDPIAPALPYTMQTDDHAQPLYSGQYLPEFQTQHRPGCVQPSYSSAAWPELQDQTHPSPAQSLYSDPHRQVIQVQPQPVGFPSWDALFADATVIGASTAVSAPSNSKNLSHLALLRNTHRQRTVPPGCWGDDQNGSTINIYDPVGLQA